MVMEGVVHAQVQRRQENNCDAPNVSQTQVCSTGSLAGSITCHLVSWLCS